MGDTPKERTPIRRHFVLTVNPGHLQMLHGRLTTRGADSQWQHRWEQSEEALQALYEGWWRHMGTDRDVRYATGQVERAPETGTLHIQAYVEMRRGFREETLGKRLCCHAEARRKSRESCRRYVTKTETRVADLDEVGQWREESSGAANWTALADLVVRGASPGWIARRHPVEYGLHARRVLDLWTALGNRLGHDEHAWEKGPGPKGGDEDE